jgi:hypothetical protein
MFAANDKQDSQELMVSGDEEDRLTHDIRLWSWRKNSTRIITSLEEEGLKWLTLFVSQRDRSKFGFRIEG